MLHTRLIRAIKDNNDLGIDKDITFEELQTLQRSGGRALSFMPDNGLGTIKFWRIQNNSPVAATPNGIFFGSSAYVMKYQYRTEDNKDAYIIYYWQVSVGKSFCGLMAFQYFPDFAITSFQFYRVFHTVFYLAIIPP